MRYFPPELLSEANSLDDSDSFEAATRRFERRLKSYNKQLATLKNRVTASVWHFITRVNKHDGTLLALEAGDFVLGARKTDRAHLVNRCRATVLLRFAEPEAGTVYEVTYSGIRTLSLDFEKVRQWHWDLRNCFDDWLIDEWTAAGGDHLRHEVLFSSGAWFEVVFQSVRVKVQRTSVEGPYRGPRR